ncbi:ATP synthase subunit O, mitochondrial [Frankliniella fusca]|uniref:Oligomycin sensitivity conferral protein n=2 Tax=Arthropoda TaxID=6656 RepID=A0AAE1H0U0_9NEOP|nr:ATP synthase subunit O, mitochondrial [Frankliniella fusca]
MATPRIGMTVRSFSSSSAVRQAMVKPPIQIFGLEGRYATALFSGASKQKTLDAVEKDLTGLQSQLKNDPKLIDYLLNPSIKKTVKVAAIQAAAKQMNMSASTANLLSLMAENNRLKNLNGTINAFKQIMAAVRGEVPCEITSAKPLDAATLKEIEGALKGFLKSNQKTLISTKTDPSIIGGLIISIGDKYCDMSIASKVRKYSKIIAESA